VVRLGGGRMRASDRIDPAVGLSDVAEIGEALEQGDPLAIVHAADEDEAEGIAAELVAAFTLGDDFEDPPALVKACIT
jgi:thymidine phosphorylase